MEELELTTRAGQGDPAAFRELVQAHQAAVYRYALTLVARREDAEDVLQEVFLSFLRHADGFRGDASLRTWLLTITRHTAFRLRKKIATRPEDSAELDQLGFEAGWGLDDPERLAMKAENGERLRAALDSLNPGDKEMLVLCDLEDLPARTAAAAAGISLAAAKSRLHRGRLRLAAALRKEASR